MADPKNQNSDGASGAVTVHLDDTVVVDNVTHTSLTFRKRKMRDLVAADSVDGITRKEAAVFASMAGVTLPVILDLSADDHDKMLEKTAPLMGKSWEAVKMDWMTQGALSAGVTVGVQAEIASKKQSSD